MSGRKPDQLAFSLPVAARLDRAHFVLSACNAAALAFVERWPAWPGPAALIWGPPGAGKTHLKAIWQAKSGAQDIEFSERSLSRVTHEAPAAAALDDADRAAAAAPELLTHFLNWSRNEGVWLLLTGAAPPAGWTGLADLSSRLKALPGAEIGAPDDDLLRAVIAKQFADRQLRINAKVIDYMVARMERSLAFAGRLVERLDAAALAEGRSVTMTLAEQVLAELSDRS